MTGPVSSGEQVLVVDSGNYVKCLVSKEFATKYNLSLVELARTLVNEDSELVCGLTSSWTGKDFKDAKASYPETLTIKIRRSEKY